MSTLSHGSNLTLAPTLGPLVHATAKTPRDVLTSIASAGFSNVQLDATLPGIRPRDLDQSARRDLLATVKRSGLSICGIDFFIPAEHYCDPTHIDRATQAVLNACAFAGDMGRIPLNLNLPIGKVDAGVAQAILDQADACGITLAIHEEADLDQLNRWVIDQNAPHIGIGLDPAAHLIRNQDPTQSAQLCSKNLLVARLSDASLGQADGGRQVVGSGSLALLPYRVSIDLAPNRVGPVVLDLRGLASPLQAMAFAKTAWDSAAIQL